MSKKNITSEQNIHISQNDYTNPIPSNNENNFFNPIGNINITINSEIENSNIINSSPEEKLNTDGINNVKQLNSNYNNIDDINIATNQYITSFNINNNSSDNSSYIFKKNPLDSTILNKLKPVEIKDENQKSKIEYNCVICMEKYKLRDKYIILPCKHIFHEHCIKTWFKQSNICPICKSKIDINDTNNEI